MNLNSQEFSNAIASAILVSSKDAIDIEVANAQKAVEQRIRANAAGVCANVVRHMSMQRFGDELVVTLRIPDPKQP